MKKKFFVFSMVLMVTALATMFLFPVFPAVAEEETMQEEMQTDTAEDKQIFGYKLMTRKERAEFRARIRAAETQAEREAIRKEHHEKMKARAKKRGITMPENPPGQGIGYGKGGKKR